MTAVGIIPARYEASRFPGKALASIAGQPMLPVRDCVLSGKTASMTTLRANGEFRPPVRSRARSFLVPVQRFAIQAKGKT